jgi:hypothetical protein
LFVEKKITITRIKKKLVGLADLRKKKAKMVELYKKPYQIINKSQNKIKNIF